MTNFINKEDSVDKIIEPTESEINQALVDKDRLSIMVIPLDNRPVNINFPKEIANISDVKLVFPPSEFLGNHKIKGDTERIKEWIFENAEEVDAFVISLTMMNHGGLLHSRYIAEGIDVNGKLDWLIDLDEKYPDKPFYAFDTIQRLAISIKNQSDMEIYNKIRKWAILKGGNNKKVLKELEKEISNDILDKYINT